MGLEPFPKDCSLSVVVREGKEIDRLTYAPIGKREDNVHVYKFPMPGLGFTLVVSKNIPQNYREKCFVHGPGKPHRCNDAHRKISYGRRGQDTSAEISGSLKLKALPSPPGSRANSRVFSKSKLNFYSANSSGPRRQHKLDFAGDSRCSILLNMNGPARI